MTDWQNERSRIPRHGLTLVELVVVLTILVALAGLALPRLMSTAELAGETAARASLVVLRDATSQLWRDCKYDLDALSGADRRLALTDLITARSGLRLFDPSVTLGWNGPYVEQTGTYAVTGATAADYTTVYGSDGDAAVLDPWRRPFVIQEPNPATTLGLPRDVRIVSAGEDGIFTITEATASTDLLSGSVNTGDDIYVSITLR
ncbi:MAG: prepilin-type N-terminal cleavage/methylation domain-containing protein [Planctomycetota bacterium]